MRLRLIGGRVTTSQLRALVDVAERYGDGRVHLTTRANLQLRALPGVDGALSPSVLDDLEHTGLLPSRSHELVRNVLVSPQTGLAGGRADLRRVAIRLDRLLLADPDVARLSGRFLFVLDDGRGDLLDRPCDLGLVALDRHLVQLRVGAGWGPVLPTSQAADAIATLAGAFARSRGAAPDAPWHVAELAEPLCPVEARDHRVPAPTPPLAFGPVPGGRHVGAPDGVDRALVDRLADAAAPGPHLVVTPWRGVLVPAAHAIHHPEAPQEAR